MPSSVTSPKRKKQADDKIQSSTVSLPKTPDPRRLAPGAAKLLTHPKGAPTSYLYIRSSSTAIFAASFVSPATWAARARSLKTAGQ
ncbi:hypothetical protein LIA77_04690 [Sarocladium implicatum]|nr:hypothetical protein LIA77_04690 [Sarocladium implicatum]